ncbi:hypothetical protein Trydic_g16177 [Trypoxylus dichotomus]
MKLANTTKIGLSWCVIVIAGVYAFYLSKSSIEQKRYDHMKIRERIKQSNVGQYEPSSRKALFKQSQYEVWVPSYTTSDISKDESPRKSLTNKTFIVRTTINFPTY